MKPTFTIWLTDTNRYAGPVVLFNGFRGTHRFTWNEAHRAHILDGRELSAEEFNKAALDIFTAEPGRNYFKAVPKAVPVPEEKKPQQARKVSPKVYDTIAHPTNTLANPVVRLQAPAHAEA